MKMDESQLSEGMKRSIRIMAALVDTVKEAGEHGAPSGPMYAAVMTQGVTLEVYLKMMTLLVDKGILRHANHVYYCIEGAL